jgi:hypothetical protein
VPVRSLERTSARSGARSPKSSEAGCRKATGSDEAGVGLRNSPGGEIPCWSRTRPVASVTNKWSRDASLSDMRLCRPPRGSRDLPVRLVFPRPRGGEQVLGRGFG